MTTGEIINKVKQIEYKIKRTTNALFLGKYRSFFKGVGMTFSEIRPYQFGDDVRKIDWNKTAQFNEPHVKIFQEERELTMMLLVDISHSMDFSTRNQLKREIVEEIVAILAFSAFNNNDKVGLILFSNKVYKIIPPGKGKTYILRIIRDVIDFKYISSPTNFNYILNFLMKIMKRKSIVFIFSDFYDLNEGNSLKILSKKHDLHLIHIFDEKERNFPDIGLIEIKDPESGKYIWFNSRKRKNCIEIEKKFKETQKKLYEKSNNYSFNYNCICTNEDYIKLFLSIFNKGKKIR